MAVAIVTSFVANKLTDGEVDTLGTHLGTHRRRWQDYPAEERLGRAPTPPVKSTIEETVEYEE